MADGTHISWTEATWNPITGCSVLSPGCVPCYAMQLAGTRLRNHPSRAGLTTMAKTGPVWNGEVRFNEQWLDQPIRWTRPRRIFVVAHGDIGHENVPDSWIAKIFSVMVEAPQHEYQVLTKRIDRIAALLDGPKYHSEWHPKLWHRSVLPNALIGTSVESQPYADLRRPHLERLAERGWRTWVSYEPALGPVDWSGWQFIRWLVSGGQSSQGSQVAKPSHPDWHRAARDFCAVRGIPYHFKQWGEWAPAHNELLGEMQFVHAFDDGTRVGKFGKKQAGAVLDGVEHRAFPA
jgi:protein gp37